MKLSKLNFFISPLKCRLVRQMAIVFLVVLANFLLIMAPIRAGNLAGTEMTVYRDPSCSCCGGWMERLADAGFQINEISTPDVGAIKQQYRVPENLTSCHTALVDGYVLEGHVPIADIQRLLTERPQIAGITVPGMPIGTPGMENGDQRDSFTVFSFDEQGNVAPFNQYSF